MIEHTQPAYSELVDLERPEARGLDRHAADREPADGQSADGDSPHCGGTERECHHPGRGQGLGSADDLTRHGTPPAGRLMKTLLNISRIQPTARALPLGVYPGTTRRSSRCLSPRSRHGVTT
jgi:hypothetical protein